MPTRTLTIENLIANYAAPVANAAGLNAGDYDQTAAGLASLLHDTAEDISPTDQTRGWLEDAAANLDAIARLGDDSPQARELMTRIDATLYETKSDLEMH